MSDMNNDQSCHFFSFDNTDQPKFKKRILRKPFNSEDHLEGINNLMNKVEKIFLKLTSAYTRNAIFEINRQSDLYYDVVIKSLDDITNVLKNYSNQIPKEIRLSIADNIKTLNLATLVLKQEKNDWDDKFSRSNDPEFDVFFQKAEENLSNLLLKIEKVENLDKLFENHDFSIPKL